MTSPTPSPPTPASLFAGWLARREAGEEADLEALCRDHPARADGLRELHAQWKRLERVRREAGLEGSLSERLTVQYGSEADPKVTLEGEQQGQSDFSSEILERLSGRGPASTRYRLKGEVAHGGMGAVLRVWDEDLRRHLAMKVMLGTGEATESGETPTADPRLLARFLEEAQVTGQLDHPNIVPVHELGLDAEGRVYFTMKLVKGKTLKEVFDLVRERKEGWTQVRALNLLLKVCEAMAYAHDKGVIHRDLKPANVMVGRYGEVFVMDWGLAKILGREDARDVRVRPEPGLTSTAVGTDRKDHAAHTPDSPLYTMDGDVVGTPAYMSPEQANGDLAAMGPHSDVYSLGAMLYHLLAGHMPYVPIGAKVNNYAVWTQVQLGPPQPLHERAPDAHAELAAICERAMAREPGRRYADTAALAEDLSAYVEGRVVRAYETGAWAEARKWVKRNKQLAAALAIALLAVTTGGVGFAIKADQATTALNETTRLKDEALTRERELQVRGLIQDLEAFESLDDSPEFAQRQHRSSREWWLERARLLVEGRPEDPARGDSWRPGLEDAEEQLALLRSQSREPTAEEVVADRAAHTLVRRLTAKKLDLEWHRRMLGLDAWPAEAEVMSRISPDELEADAETQNRIAWSLVNPSAPASGEETKALLLAWRALDRAGEENRAAFCDTLALALYRTGRFEEAVELAREAVGEIHEKWERRIELEPRRESPERSSILYEISEYEYNQGHIESSIPRWSDGRAEARLEQLTEEVRGLEERVGEWRSWRFDESELAWWHGRLESLVSDLKRLDERIAIVESSISSDAAVVRWAEATERIAGSAEYGELQLGAQLGLLPLGPDPVSGLWEFAHLQSGEPARRGSDGKLVVTPGTGLVFVLLPGGAFWMGSQAEDPSARNYYAAPYYSRHFNESPVHEVEVSPFFLSKYEMTVGQWRRVASWSPLSWDEPQVMLPDGYVTPLLPVHDVSWDDCTATLSRMDAWIGLPSGAQWEYACRAGTTSLYSCDEEVLEQHAWFAKPGENPPPKGPRPIAGKEPNPFGLHDVHGNVWEWCRDGWDRDFYHRSPRLDPVFPWVGALYRESRGGCFAHPAGRARSATRTGSDPSAASRTTGLRPARAITP